MDIHEKLLDTIKARLGYGENVTITRDEFNMLIDLSEILRSDFENEYGSLEDQIENLNERVEQLEEAEETLEKIKALLD